MTKQARGFHFVYGTEHLTAFMPETEYATVQQRGTKNMT
jgi:hypothetical protein